MSAVRRPALQQFVHFALPFIGAAFILFQFARLLYLIAMDVNVDELKGMPREFWVVLRRIGLGFALYFLGASFMITIAFFAICSNNLTAFNVVKYYFTTPIFILLPLLSFATGSIPFGGYKWFTSWLMAVIIANRTSDDEIKDIVNTFGNDAAWLIYRIFLPLFWGIGIIWLLIALALHRHARKMARTHISPVKSTDEEKQELHEGRLVKSDVKV